MGAHSLTCLHLYVEWLLTEIKIRAPALQKDTNT